MPPIILSINAGSSSVKVSVFTTDTPLKQLAEIQVDGLTAPPAKLKYTRGDHKVRGDEIGKDIDSQESAFQHILDYLEKDAGLPEISNRESIEWACHRVVHGGDYDEPKILDSGTYNHIEELSDLAPLHNAGALGLVKAVQKLLPKATNVAFFDSAFHSSLPPHVRTYPISPEIAQRNKLRKYGFHGLSYAFITGAVAAHLKKPQNELNIIALHLGSGASACAIRSGKSLNTTMGLTPLAGLPGATRSGSVDPSLVFHYAHDAGRLAPKETSKLHITEAELILNKQSGWKALTGTTDFGTISQKAEEGDPVHKLAFDIFVDRVLQFVGSYYVALGGQVDALVFAGGIGEKGVQLRRAVTEGAKCLGFELDHKKNEKPGDEGGDDRVTDIASTSSKHRVLVCQTDEQLEMARQCVAQFVGKS